MANTSLQTRSHCPQIMQLMLIFTVFLLLHFSSGFEISDVTCGPFGSEPSCPEGWCCNNDGYCGATAGFCGLGNCSSQCPSNYTQCGLQYNNVGCPDLSSCCNSYGWCGTGNAWCGVNNCTYQCPIGICGVNGVLCPDGSCCNIFGYCGTSDGYCGANCASQCSTIQGSPVLAPALAPGPASPLGKTRRNHLGITVGVSVGAVALLLGCITFALFIMRNPMRRKFYHRGLKAETPTPFDGIPERVESTTSS